MNKETFPLSIACNRLLIFLMLNVLVASKWLRFLLAINTYIYIYVFTYSRIRLFPFYNLFYNFTFF